MLQTGRNESLTEDSKKVQIPVIMIEKYGDRKVLLYLGKKKYYIKHHGSHDKNKKKEKVFDYIL